MLKLPHSRTFGAVPSLEVSMSFLRSRIFSLAAVLLAGMLLVTVGRAEAQPPGGPGGPDSPDLLLLEKIRR